jgi:hypothetical protein
LYQVEDGDIMIFSRFNILIKKLNINLHIQFLESNIASFSGYSFGLNLGKTIIRETKKGRAEKQISQSILFYEQKYERDICYVSKGESKYTKSIIKGLKDSTSLLKY